MILRSNLPYDYTFNFANEKSIKLVKGNNAISKEDLELLKTHPVFNTSIKNFSLAKEKVDQEPNTGDDN